MAETLHAAYKPLADSIAYLPLPALPLMDISGQTRLQAFGDALFIRKRPELKRRILLSGHMDTVYPASSPFQTLSYLNAGEIKGPGVTDMKGGLVVMLHALSAFEQSSLAPLLGWDVLINSEEEIGSPASRFLFDEWAPHYQTALLYEPSMTTQGTLAKNRRGSGKFTLIAHGKAAHAGRNFEEGRNAICYLAKVILAIHALNKTHDGISINIGKIAGGEALNVVPNQAVAQLDVRITLAEQEDWVKNQLDSLIEQFKCPDYSLNLYGGFVRPVKQVSSNTEALFHRLQQVGKALGLSLEWQNSGGCCDGNNLAQHGLAVLDTLGVRGSHIHSEEETILVDSLPERAALSTLLLMDLAQGGLEELNK